MRSYPTPPKTPYKRLPYVSGGVARNLLNALSSGARIASKYATPAAVARGISMVQKYRQSKRPLRSSVYTTGVHGGKVYFPKRNVKYRRGRRGRRVYTKPYKSLFKGVMISNEANSFTVDDKVVYLGHATGNYYVMFQALCAAILKSCVAEMGTNIPDLSLPFRNNINTADELTFQYKVNDSGAAVALTYVVLAADISWYDLANKMTSNLILQMQASAVNSQKLIWYNFSIFSGVTRKAQVNLLDLKVNFFTKSALKMQNRTLPVAGADQVDDINNVPLISKSYAGWGNGPIYKSVMQLPTCSATADFGAIGFGAVANKQLQEPPQPSCFATAVKTGKMNIGPGQIKTSVLTHKVIVNFDDFMLELSRIYSQGVATPYTKFRYSKYILYAFEKTMAVTGEGQVSIYWEYDVKNWCSLLPRIDRFTIPYVNTAT